MGMIAHGLFIVNKINRNFRLISGPKAIFMLLTLKRTVYRGIIVYKEQPDKSLPLGGRCHET